MKQITVPPTWILPPNLSLRAAFDLIFGESTLRKVHGASMSVTEWRDDRRTVKFEMPVNVPAPIRPFFCGNSVRVTTRQTRTFDKSSSVTVTNKLRMHFVGAELFIVRPTFVITHDPHGISVSGSVESHALLPPGICNIAETFMSHSAENELKKFKKVIGESFHPLQIS